MSDHGGPDLPSPGVGRREARERAVQLVYEAEQRELDAETLLAEQALEPDDYTATLVLGVDAHAAELDALISRFAKGWTIDRMPSLDRAVLRVAIFELAHRPEVPSGVVLNEAVELSNTYGTDDSGRFVNGVLSAVNRELRPDGSPGRADTVTS